MNAPDNPQDPTALIVLRMPRSRKGRYVAASRARGMKLFDWILATLDAASQPIPPDETHQHKTTPPAAP
jgi:hypothetical protein